MSQENPIKISKFQIDNDEGLLLISEADGLPFLEVNEKGVTFDAGPFTGFFCALEGLSKFFILKENGDAPCTLQLKFAEEDIYPIGGFSSSDPQYNNALCWVMTANKKIAQKNGTARGYSIDFADVVMRVIETSLEKGKKQLTFNTTIEDALDSLERQNLIYKAEERFSIFFPENIFAQIKKIDDLIECVNALVPDETVFFPQKFTGTTEKINMPGHAHTTQKLLQ